MSGYLDASLPGRTIDPLVKWHELTGNEAALKTAERAANWFVNMSGWIKSDGTFIPTPGNQSIPGYDPRGHVESRMRPLAGVLRLAIMKKDKDLIQWCKRVFDFVESYTGGIGWYPENVFYNRTGAIKPGASRSETCCIRYGVYIATHLAKRAGYPEYWNIAERTARNHLIESQLQNISWVKIEKPQPPETPQYTYVEWRKGHWEAQLAGATPMTGLA